MKTTADLNALIPTLVDLIRNNEHEIGDSYWEQNEDGYGRCSDYESNSICYEEGGWTIEISYKCTGEWDNTPGDYWTPPCYNLIKAWGEVEEITASHYDEDTEEEVEFTDDDLNELWKALDKELEDIA